MKRFLFRITAFVLLVAIIGAIVSGPSIAVSRAAQTGPALLKASVIVRANRLLRYWKAPDTDNYWSWMPEMSFTVVGPINTGSAFVVDFTNEAGAPWYSVECETPTIDASRCQTIVTPPITTHIDNHTTPAPAPFAFTFHSLTKLPSTNATH